MPVSLWYGLGAVACLVIGLFFAYRRWVWFAALCGVAAAALFVTALWTVRRMTTEEAFGRPLTKSSAKLGVVYDIVGGLNTDYPSSGLRTRVIVRERYGDPEDLRFFEYPGRPVSRAFTVEKDAHGIPTVRYAPDGR